MAVVTERTQYLSLAQIEAVCAGVADRLLVGGEEVIATLRRELVAISANGLRASALGQGRFGAHLPRPGVVALAGPGGVGKTFFAELVARVVYGETFDAHLIGVNCRVYAAGRFPPVPPAALAARPLAIVALDGAEVLPGIPPVATLWADAVRSGRAAFPATGPQGQPLQQELHFGRCLIVATANLGREQVAHVGFRPGAATEVDAAVATRLIRDALGERFADGPGEFFPADRWLVLPPLQREDLRRLVDLELATLAELLPVGSPPVEISGAAADRLIALALAARSSNKSVALVELLRRAVEPPVDAVLLRQAAPVPLQVRIDVDGEGVGAEVVPAPARRAGPETA